MTPRPTNRTASRRSVRPVAVTMAMVLATGFAVGLPALESQATTTTLVAAVDLGDLADQVVDIDYTAGAPLAIVAQDSPEAIQLAANYAARHSAALIVASSASDATDVVSRLGDLNATSIVKISSTPSWFTSGWDSGIAAASVTISGYFQGNDLFARWAAAAYDPSASEYVVARTDEASSVRLATAYATNHGLPLVLWETGTPLVDLAAFFESVAGAKISHFGTVDSYPPVPEGSSETVLHLDAADAIQRSLLLAVAAEVNGSDTARVVVSASDSNAETAIAALHAHNSGAIALPAGLKASITTDSPAAEILQLWGPETRSLELVGLGVTIGQLNALGSLATIPRSASPVFRVTNVTKGTSSYSVALTSISGATSYAAYDLEGNVVASSSTPTLTFSTQPTGLQITASSASSLLAQTNFRINQYLAAGDRDTAVVSTTDAGDNHLLFLSDIDTPRLIARTMYDPFAEFPTENPPVAIALTCAETFTDLGLDPTKQYTYSVIDLTNVDSHTCNPGTPATPATTDPTVVAEVPVPLTEFPFEARTGDTSVLAASPTKVEMMIAAASLGSTDVADGATVAAQQHANENSDAARGPGDGWPPLKFIWVAYIPEAKFVMAVTPQPDGPGPPTPYPYLIAGGDGHGSYQPNASNRFRQELTFYFGSSHTIAYGETMGQSHLWQCNFSNGTDCINHSSAYASLTQLSATSISGMTSGTAHVTAAAEMPLIPFSPPINTDWTIKLSTGGSSIVGTHDNMPQHEIYAGIYPGHADRIYQGAYYGANIRGLACLVPFGPACTTRFNLTL